MVILDGVEDPNNLGVILRTMEAGFHDGGLKYRVPRLGQAFVALQGLGRLRAA